MAQNGKGDTRIKPAIIIPKPELELRDNLWRARDEDKPEMLRQLKRMVDCRLNNSTEAAQ